MRERAEDYLRYLSDDIRKAEQDVVFVKTDQVPTSEEIYWVIKELERNECHETRYTTQKQLHSLT